MGFNLPQRRKRDATFLLFALGLHVCGSLLSWTAWKAKHSVMPAPATDVSALQVVSLKEFALDPPSKPRAPEPAPLPGTSKQHAPRNAGGVSRTAPRAMQAPAAVQHKVVSLPVPLAEKVEQAQDQLDDALPDPFASETLPPPVPARVGTKPVFASSLTRKGTSSVPGTDHGVGSGDGDGPGAGGAPFGGVAGAFHGAVCAIPEGTVSIHSLGECPLLSEVYTDNFNIPTRPFETGFPGVPRTEWFAILYTGSFSVSRSGTHEFALASDDGSILEIDGVRVVDNDGHHGSVVRRGAIPLSAGKHSLRLRYFQGPRRYIALQLWVTAPGAEKRLFGPAI